MEPANSPCNSPWDTFRAALPVLQPEIISQPEEKFEALEIVITKIRKYLHREIVFENIRCHGDYFVKFATTFHHFDCGKMFNLHYIRELGDLQQVHVDTIKLRLQQEFNPLKFWVRLGEEVSIEFEVSCRKDVEISLDSHGSIISRHESRHFAFVPKTPFQTRLLKAKQFYEQSKVNIDIINAVVAKVSTLLTNEDFISKVKKRTNDCKIVLKLHFNENDLGNTPKDIKIHHYVKHLRAWEIAMVIKKIAEKGILPMLPTCTYGKGVPSDHLYSGSAFVEINVRAKYVLHDPKKADKL